MNLYEVVVRAAPYAYRYGAERELWIADLAKSQKAVQASLFTDELGDPLVTISKLELADFEYADWSILAEDDTQ